MWRRLILGYVAGAFSGVGLMLVVFVAFHARMKHLSPPAKAADVTRKVLLYNLETGELPDEIDDLLASSGISPSRVAYAPMEREFNLFFYGDASRRWAWVYRSKYDWWAKEAYD